MKKEKKQKQNKLVTKILKDLAGKAELPKGESVLSLLGRK